MSENMEVIGTEGTTPTVETESTEESAAEVAQETVETTVGTDETDTGEGTTPPVEEEAASAQEAESTTGDESEPFTLPVQFNHEHRELTLDEARTYAQKGMRAEAMLDKLQLIASANGKTVEQTVNDLFGAFERSHRNEILQRVGGNEEAADALMEKKRQEWNVASQTARETEKQAEQDSRKALEDRLAAGFADIARDFPEYDQFKKLPREVVQDAIKNGRDLYDSLLRYKHAESRRVNANKQAQEKAAAASVGSQASTATEDPKLDSIDRAFFSALGK